jgi:hypothetical protein
MMPGLLNSKLQTVFEALELAFKSSGYETQQNHLWQYAFESCSCEKSPNSKLANKFRLF